MRAPKWWRQFHAWVGGYFWLPCPQCGEMFGGHEPWGGTFYDGKRAMACCQNCPGN